MTEQIITILIYIHAFFGGLGLISGLFSIIARKGGNYHRKAGKVFTYSMLINAILSCFVATMPNHENMFLFLIGVFTIYMVLAGNRALTFKTKTKVEFVDSLLSLTMLLAATSMVVISFVVFGKNNHSLTGGLFQIFGLIGIFMSLTDLRMYRNFKEDKTSWLKNHLSKMTGAFIASVTAFLVVAIKGGSYIFWLAPTVLGTIYIFYWIRKVKKTR